VKASAAAKPAAEWAVIGALLCLAGWMNLELWPTVTPDMRDYLLPWYRHILHHGPLGAFAAPFSNYTPTYLYLLAAASMVDPWISPADVIKIVSLGGTIFLAFSVVRLGRASGAERPALAGCLVLLLPTPLLNAAFLGQCDAFWAGCCLLSLAGAMERRTMAMLVWAGLAVSFKAQAAFFAPVVIGVLLHRREPAILWLVPGAVYAAVMLPAFLAGWPALDLAAVYVRQATELSDPGNAANPWVVGRVFAPELTSELFLVGYGAAAVAAIAIVEWVRRKGEPALLVQMALTSAFLVPWLLPKMHERYFMLADILAFVLAITQPSRLTLAIAVLVQGASTLAYIAYTGSDPTPVLVGAMLGSTALLLLILKSLPLDRINLSAGRAPNSSGYSANAT
jgi:Gpi18-like mannosyltransferase